MALRPMQKLSEPAFAADLFAPPPGQRPQATPVSTAAATTDYRPAYEELEAPLLGASDDEADLAALRALEELGFDAEPAPASGRGWQTFATGEDQAFPQRAERWDRLLGGGAAVAGQPQTTDVEPEVSAAAWIRSPRLDEAPAREAADRRAQRRTEPDLEAADVFKARLSGGPIWEAVDVDETPLSARDAGVNPRLESLVRSPQPAASRTLADEIELG